MSWRSDWTATAAIPALAPRARAELVIDVRRGNFQPIPIAIADFSGEGELGPKVSGVISGNLGRSGYFAPMDRERFPERPSFDAAPNFAAWRGTGAQGLVTGRVARDGSGRIKAEFRLWDIVAGQQIVGQQYVTDAASWRRIGHIISDAVYSKITGVGGFFDTRIAFVDESGPKERRRKRLAVMDQDGANVRFLTPGENTVVSPRYSPVTQDIAFMSQASGQQPRVQIINLETGSRQVVGNFDDMSSSPRFGPDGRRLFIALQEGGNSNIYAMDLASRQTTRLTSGSAIDTSPSPSPDGREIAFESDRGGKQQIYVMSADGGGARRVSFGDGAYSQPAWSPRGDLIAFTKQRPGGVRDRCHETGRVRRAHPDGGLPQRGPDLGAQRAVPRHLPRSRRPVRRQAPHGRHHRQGGCGAPDPVLCLGSDLVAAAQRRPLSGGGARRATGRAETPSAHLDRAIQDLFTTSPSAVVC